VAENPFVGAWIAVIVAFSSLLIGHALLASKLDSFTASARLGISGLLGLGIIGTVVFLVGLVSVKLVVFPVVFLCAICAHPFWKHLKNLRGRLPTNPLAWILFISITALILLRLPAALSPSLGGDWDSLSHQLAMAKIWLQHGKVDYIDFMHQSNVPATANMLYMLVLPGGGQAAAKVLAMFFGIFAALAFGGITEKRYGKNAGWWAALAVVAAPVVLWEVGTAYVDVFHGACFGVSAVLAAMWLEKREEKSLLLVSAVFMAIALATKYTAIQSGGAMGVAMVIIGGGAGARSALIVGGIALLLASPWYIRNIVNTGNPVYPFFYSVFGGRNWSEANAVPYAAEQQSFGIGQDFVDGKYRGKNPVALPGSMTALALRPDTQINQGSPFGAVGPVLLLGLLWWPLSGLRGKGAFEKTLVLTALITLISWFFLTQQSRYIISLIMLAAPLVGGAISMLPLGRIVAVGVAAQAFYTCFLFLQLPLGISGTASLDSFEFYPETRTLNEIGKHEEIKVAIYDEVRGYYLDVPYFWANPGHHTLLPYETYETPAQLIDGLESLGVTHLVLSLGFLRREEAEEIVRAFAQNSFEVFSHTAAFRKLIILANREGLLETVQVFQNANGGVRSFIFRIR
jgi:hypothetical protein